MKSTQSYSGTLSRKLFFSGMLAMAAALAAAPALATEYWLRADVVDTNAPTAIPHLPGVPMWGFAKEGERPNGAAPAPTLDTAAPATSPGPELRVGQDGVLIVRLKNSLTVPVSLVISGLESQTFQVNNPTTPRYFGQDASGRKRVRSFVNEIPPGGTRIYKWTNVKPGAYLYHSGTQPQVQVQMGLYGAVLGQDAGYTQEITLLYSEIDPDLHLAVQNGTYGRKRRGYPSTVNYAPKYFLLNGQTDPAPITAAPNNTTLVHFLNAGLRTRVPVLHGGHFRLIREDGYAYPYPREQYSVTLPALKAMDAELAASGAGTKFMIHDHRLNPDTPVDGTPPVVGTATALNIQ